jgi:steroid delta-isomerase-like uncharacterized protein
MSSPTSHRASRRLACFAATAAAAATVLVGAAPAAAGSVPASPSQGGSSLTAARPLPRIVTRWAAAWNSGSPDRMAALFTADGVYEDLAFQTTFRGPEGVATWVSITTRSIRDARVEVLDAFRRGDRVAVRWTFSGRDTGAFAPGLPPTAGAFSVPASSLFELRGGKLRRVTDFYNLADLLRQVGLPAGAYTPAPAP